MKINAKVNGQRSMANSQPYTQQAAGSTHAAPTRIRLHIGELALHGFDHVDPVQLGNSVQQELTRLLVEQGTPAPLEKSGGQAHLEGGAFTVESGANSEMMGARIARAIYRGLER